MQFVAAIPLIRLGTRCSNRDIVIEPLATNSSLLSRRGKIQRRGENGRSGRERERKKKGSLDTGEDAVGETRGRERSMSFSSSRRTNRRLLKQCCEKRGSVSKSLFACFNQTSPTQAYEHLLVCTRTGHFHAARLPTWYLSTDAWPKDDCLE